jgi:hypothetical protein
VRNRISDGCMCSFAVQGKLLLIVHNGTTQSCCDFSSQCLMTHEHDLCIDPLVHLCATFRHFLISISLSYAFTTKKRKEKINPPRMCSTRTTTRRTRHRIPNGIMLLPGISMLVLMNIRLLMLERRRIMMQMHGVIGGALGWRT